MRAGGDTRTPQARQEIARREEQIVALRLRSFSFAAIGRQLGISRQSVQRAYQKALQRNTDQDIRSHHRSELAKLEMEEANIWRLMDANKDNWKAGAVLIGVLNRIHIRRARLLGLDAPQKLDIGDMYGAGTDEASADRLRRERMLASLPVAEQIRWLEMFEEAENRLLTTPVDITGKVITNGPDQGTDSDDALEHHKK